MVMDDVGGRSIQMVVRVLIKSEKEIRCGSRPRGYYGGEGSVTGERRWFENND